MRFDLPNYPPLPHEEWRHDAACSFSADLRLWDANVDDELPREKRARHALAVMVCESCPVIDKCAASVDLRWDEGVRAGQVLPEKKNPGARRWAA